MLHNEQIEIKNSEPDNKNAIAVLPDEMISIVSHQDINVALSFGKTSKKYNELILNKKFYLNRFIFLNNNQAYQNPHDKLENNNNEGMFMRSLGKAMRDGMNVISRSDGFLGVPLSLIVLVGGAAKGCSTGFFAVTTRKLIEINEVKRLPLYLECCSRLSDEKKDEIINKIVLEYTARSRIAGSTGSTGLLEKLRSKSFGINDRWYSFQEYMLCWDKDKNIFWHNGKRLFGIGFAELKSRVSHKLISAVEEELSKLTMGNEQSVKKIKI